MDTPKDVHVAVITVLAKPPGPPGVPGNWRRINRQFLACACSFGSLH
ncbi:hypothetical protein ACFWIY_23750 [Streptomyces sioyaensis]